MSFGSRFRKAREKKGLSQQELADLIGATDGTISNYEKGVAFPRWDTMRKLCDILNVDPNYLFWDDLSDNLKSKIIDDMTFNDKAGETLILSRYKKLDNHGREIIDSVMSIELKRINDEERQAVIPTKSAAFGGQADNTPITEDEMERAAALAREIRNQQNMD